MSINKWFFDFHLVEQGWVSTPPYREEGQRLRPPGASIVTLRMIELGSDDRPDTWYKAEVAHVDSNRGNVTELMTQHGLPKAILVNCWSQKEELEQLLLHKE